MTEGDERASVGRSSIAAKVAVPLISTLLSLCVVEVGYRISAGIPVFSLLDWREQHIIQSLVQNASDYDPVLGWRMKSGLTGGSLNTIGHGFRKNAPDTTVRTGGVLLVGDSYGVGSEVNDDETMPAQLERMLGQPVMNGATGGWGTDQIVMRAEEMIPVVQPSTIVLAFHTSAIGRAGYSYYGYAKPYYTIQDGELVYHGPGEGAPPAQTDWGPVKQVLGRSAVLDAMLVRYASGFWLANTGERYQETINDEVDVTCRLLERLKHGADETQARVALSVIYGGLDVSQNQEPDESAQLVNECAAELGVQVVDGFPSLRTLYDADAAGFREYFVMHGDEFGHMSAKGNQHVARLIADALGAPPAPETASDSRNLAYSEFLDSWLDQRDITQVQRKEGDSGPRQFEIAAAGGEGEHYAVGLVSNREPGFHTVSFEVHPNGMPIARAQLLDVGLTSGVIATFDFGKSLAETTSVGGAATIASEMIEVGDGWYRVWLGADLPPDGKLIILQVVDGSGNFRFSSSPDQPTLTVRSLQLEQGDSPSPYSPARGTTP